MLTYDPIHPVFRSAEEAARRHVMRRACRDQAITNARTIIRRRGETGDPALVVAHLQAAVANGATPDHIWKKDRP